MWWLAAIAVVVALFQARELALIVIIGISAYWLLVGIASLPVSAAIIIGALIIASAIRRK